MLLFVCLEPLRDHLNYSLIGHRDTNLGFQEDPVVFCREEVQSLWEMVTQSAFLNLIFKNKCFSLKLEISVITTSSLCIKQMVLCKQALG